MGIQEPKSAFCHRLIQWLKAEADGRTNQNKIRTFRTLFYCAMVIDLEMGLKTMMSLGGVAPLEMHRYLGYTRYGEGGGHPGMTCQIFIAKFRPCLQKKPKENMPK